MALVPTVKNCDPSVRRAIQKLARLLGSDAAAIFTDLRITGLTAGLMHTDDNGNVLSGSLYVSEYGALFVED